MVGYLATLDNEAWRRSVSVDVTYGIGRDGSASQYSNIFTAHWGNGVTGATGPADRRGIDRYDRSNRHLKAIERSATWIYVSGRWWLAQKRAPGVSALNARSISTEHEGFPFDRPGFDATWPEPMIEMSIRLKRWTMEEFSRYNYEMPPVDADLFVGHHQIDAINRLNCPGPEWPKARILAALKPATTVPPDDEGDDMALTEEDKNWLRGLVPNKGAVRQLCAEAFHKAATDKTTETNEGLREIVREEVAKILSGGSHGHREGDD